MFTRTAWMNHVPLVAMMLWGIGISFDAQSFAQENDDKLGNGRLVTNENAITRPVVLLYRASEGRAGTIRYSGHCTGTFVNDTTLITAYHCLQEPQRGGVHVTHDGRRFVSSRNAFFLREAKAILDAAHQLKAEMADLAARNLSETGQCTIDSNSSLGQMFRAKQREHARLYSELPKVDIAVVVFPEGTGRSFAPDGTFYEIAERSPSRQSRLLHIGFGQSQTNIQHNPDLCTSQIRGEGSGVKRWGYGSISMMSDSQITTIGFSSANTARDSGVELGHDVSVRPGDSGGPWVLCANHTCSERKLLGVTSTGTFRGEIREFSHGPNLTSDYARQLFQAAVHCSEPRRCAAAF